MIFVVLIIILGIGIAGAVMFGRRQQVDAVSNRLAQFTERSMSLEELELQLPFRQRVIAPILNNVFAKVGKAAKSNDKLRVNLMLAGNPGNLTPAMFTGMRVVLMVGLFGMVALVGTLGGWAAGDLIKWSGVSGGIGYLLPATWLGRQIKKRQKLILKALPDALDLLVISVTAGLGFDAALQRVAEK
jgi:tight adherence protein C